MSSMLGAELAYGTILNHTSNRAPFARENSQLASGGSREKPSSPLFSPRSLLSPLSSFPQIPPSIVEFTINPIEHRIERSPPPHRRSSGRQSRIASDMPGRVSSQSGAQLPGVSPQNGNVVPNIVAAGSGAPHGGFGMDADLLRARNYMQEKIYVLLAQRHREQLNESQRQRLKDIVIRLEEGLFKTAPSKEEYLNMSTLEFRLHSLIKRPSLNNRNPVNPNPVGAQMSNMGGSSRVQPTSANTGNLMSSGVMQSSSFNRTDGLLSNGYQQAQANYPIGSGGNNPVTDGCAKNEQPDDSDSQN